MNTSYTSDLFASNISKECDILMGALYSVFCKSKTDNRNTTTVEKTHSPSTAPWPSPFNLHLSVFKSYCPLKGTASCYLLPTTGGPAWSQQSTSSSICPSVTLGWPSPYFHSQYLLLSATGVWKYSLFFPISLILEFHWHIFLLFVHVTAGGCLEKWPVRSTRCVESCLVCAVWPTSQPFL